MSLVEVVLFVALIIMISLLSYNYGYNDGRNKAERNHWSR